MTDIAVMVLVVAMLSTGFCLYGDHTHDGHAPAHMSSHDMTPLCAGILAGTVPVLGVVVLLPTTGFLPERTPVFSGTPLSPLDPPPEPLPTV